MSSINMGSVKKKVESWSESDRGQKRIQNKINEYIKKDVRKTKAGSTVVTLAMMRELGEKMAHYVRAESNGLPDSVAAAVASISCGAPQAMSDGSFIMELSFNADLTRPSLEPEKYSGVQNIIAIFNNGYESEAASHVFGLWHGHYTHAAGYRPALSFIQRAVDDFNSTYGYLDVTAEAAAIYS